MVEISRRELRALADLRELKKPKFGPLHHAQEDPRQSCETKHVGVNTLIVTSPTVQSNLIAAKANLIAAKAKPSIVP